MADEEDKPKVVDFQEWVSYHLQPEFINLRELGTEAVILFLRVLEEYRLLDIFQGFTMMYNHVADRFAVKMVFDERALEARGWQRDDKGNIVRKTT